MEVHLEEKVISLMLHGLEPQEGGGSGDEVGGLFPHCCEVSVNIYWIFVKYSLSTSDRGKIRYFHSLDNAYDASLASETGG